MARPRCPRRTVVERAVKEKLIEVALPLDAIDKASARENSIRHEHPSTLGLPEELLGRMNTRLSLNTLG